MKRRKSLRRTGIVAGILISVVAICFAIVAIYIRAPKIGGDSNKDPFQKGGLDNNRLAGWTRRISREDAQNSELPEGDPPETVSSNRRDGTYTILLIGTSDEYTSDTLMVATVDTENKSIHMLSIPRDTKVDARRSIKKINGGLGAGGVSLVQKEIATVVGFEPDFTVKVDLKGFISLVDAIDGVDFDVPYKMNYDDPTQDLHIHFEPGLQHLDGQKAMELVRYRGHAGSDFSRIEMQQEFLMAVAKKLLVARNIARIETFAKIYSENVKTDLTVGNLVWFGLKAYEIGTDNIHMDTIPTYTRDPSVNPYYYQYVSSAEALELINRTINPFENDITKKNVRHVQFVKPVSEKPAPTPTPVPQKPEEPTPTSGPQEPDPLPDPTTDLIDPNPSSEPPDGDSQVSPTPTSTPTPNPTSTEQSEVDD